MKILVSACLMGENCKYNGGNNRDESLMALLENHEIIMVCPEVLGGLPTPRVPSEIINGVVTNREGQVVDREFRLGAERALKIALDEKVGLAVLQPRSPSCGVKEVYDGSFTKKRVPGKGVFARLLEENGIPVIDAGDREGLRAAMQPPGGG